LVTPAKNSTFATVPSPSVAVAKNETEAGGVNTTPFAGAVRATVGEVFATTVIAMVAESVVAPALSVARAVSV